MENFKKSLAMAAVLFKRWKYDRRIWIIFAFTGAFVLKEMMVFTGYGLTLGGNCNIFIMPILFLAPQNAFGGTKLLMHIGMILLLCDAPFTRGNTSYTVLRGGRKSWWLSSFLYIAGSSFFYLFFITLVSMIAVLPIAVVSDSWGTVMEDFLYGSADMSMEEIYMLYHHIRLPELEIRYLYPDATMLYTYFAVWINFTMLGLLMYFISLFANHYLWAICGAAFLVFLDPLLFWLNRTRKEWYWRLSPVTWCSADALNVVDTNYILSVPYALSAYAVLIFILLIGIALRSKKVMIEGTLE